LKRLGQMSTSSSGEISKVLGVPLDSVTKVLKLYNAADLKLGEKPSEEMCKVGKRKRESTSTPAADEEKEKKKEKKSKKNASESESGDEKTKSSSEEEVD